MLRVFRPMLLVVAATGGVLVLSSCDPLTKTFTVTTAVDKVDANAGDGVCEATARAGDCTLRAAVQEANRATATTNTVVIKAGVNPRITRAGTTEDANGKGDFDINGTLVIEGNGATVDGGQLDRVFDHVGGTLTIRNLTITGGKLTGNGLYGGGIRSKGDLALENVTVTGNSIVGDDGHGGGVSGFGDVTVTNSTIRGNTLIGNNIWGAGVHVLIGTLRVGSSTFNANSAGGYQSQGGAIFIRGSAAYVWNSTLVDNTAFEGSAIGSGSYIDPSNIEEDPTLDLRLSTVVGNHGYYALGSAATVSGSAMAANAGVVCAPGVTSGGYNVASGDIGNCGLTQPTDSLVSDLVLGPLAANGGPTLTLMPQDGSPLLDRIPIPTHWLCGDGYVHGDQRGSPRENGPACDVGAVER